MTSGTSASTSRGSSSKPLVYNRSVLKRSALSAALLLAGCGGGSSPNTPTPPPGANTIVINASGAVTPSELVVSPGTRVLFINNHNRRHDMTSDQHPDHQDCPAINAVGVLNPGQQRETGNLVEVRTCGFHDHEDDRNPALKGRIVVR
jgi:plastocyanin